MLRITWVQNGRGTLVRPEGRIDEETLDELERVCRDLATGRRSLIVDLAGVSFVDRRGAELVRALARTGVRFVGGSAFIRTLLEEVRC